MTRGSCAIYLGAAPGVGKTYAMLEEAHRRRRARHRRRRRLRRDPRPRTPQTLLDGLEVVPRTHDRLPGRRRSPRWTSTRSWPARPRSRWSTSWPTPTCPARRNAKRWQDIEELLDAGHHRDHHGQHPAPGVAQRRRRSRSPASPQRETVPDEVVRARRPDRAGRHDPGGAAPPDGPRQHLPARARSTPRWATTSGSATSPRCASWPCSGWPTRSTTSSTGTAPSTTSTRTWEARERVVVALTGGPEGDTLIRRAARIAARSQGRRPARRARRPQRRPRRRRPGQPGPAAASWWRASAAPTTRSSATTSRRRCSTSPAASTPPSSCSAPAAAAGSPSCFSRGVGVTTTAESGPIDVHLVTHEEVSRGRRPAG